MNLRRCYCCGTEFDAGEATDEVKLSYCRQCRGMNKTDAIFYGLLEDLTAAEYGEDGEEEEDE